jgi:ABC-type antimicrobial peptide transport system permease subunit
MSERVGERLFAQRLAAVLAAAFGGVGAVIALVGLYGVVAFHTSQRRREFGIRVALGAKRGRIRRQVLGDGLRQAAFGISGGLAIALLSAGSIRSLLPGVAVWDPIAFGGAALALAVAAFAAADLPARRAAAVDPMTSLRGD